MTNDIRWTTVLTHRQRLIEIARRRLPTHADAEDCVHEALLRAVCFQPLDLERVGGFLTTTVLRICADFYRQTQRQERLLHRLVDERPVANAEQLACANINSHEILGLVEGLPGRQRAVIVARINGMTTAEAAVCMGVNTKSADSALTRARARLRREFSSLWPVAV